MASRFMKPVAGGGNWMDATPANVWLEWNGSSWVSSTVRPTREDDVVVDSSVTSTLTLGGSGALCRSLDFKGSASRNGDGSPYNNTFAMSTRNLIIGDTAVGALAPTDNVAVAFPPATGTGSAPNFAITGTHASAWDLRTRYSTGALSLDNNGRAIPNGIDVGGTAGMKGEYVLVSDFVAQAALIVTRGELDFGSVTSTINTLTSSNANVRTIKLGSGTITITSVTPFTFTTLTSLTWNKGTASVILNSASVTVTAATDFYNMTCNGNIALAGGNLVVSNVLEFAPGKVASSNIFNSATITAGTLIASGEANSSRPTFGAPIISHFYDTTTLEVTTRDFTDVLFGNCTASTAWSSTGLVRVGHNPTFGNVTNIPATPGTTHYRKGAAGNWHDDARWASSSNGSDGSGYDPLPTDTVIFDQYATDYITVDQYTVCFNLITESDFTGVVYGVSVNVIIYILGDLLHRGGTIYLGSSTSIVMLGVSSSNLDLRGNLVLTRTANGYWLTLNKTNASVSLVANTGTHTLNGSITANRFLLSGTTIFDLNGYHFKHPTFFTTDTPTIHFSIGSTLEVNPSGTGTSSSVSFSGTTFTGINVGLVVTVPLTSNWTINFIQIMDFSFVDISAPEGATSAVVFYAAGSFISAEDVSLGDITIINADLHLGATVIPQAWISVANMTTLNSNLIGQNADSGIVMTGDGSFRNGTVTNVEAYGNTPFTMINGTDGGSNINWSFVDEVYGEFGIAGAGSFEFTGSTGVEPSTGTFDISGASTLEFTGVQTALASFDISGASTLEFTGVETALASFDISGASTLEFTGVETALASFDISGASTLEFTGVQTALANFDISGASTLEFTGVQTALANFDILGASTLEFTGVQTALASFDISGNGSFAFTLFIPTLSGFVISGASSLAWNGSLEKLSSFGITGSSDLNWISVLEKLALFGITVSSDLNWSSVLEKLGSFDVISSGALEWGSVLTETGSFDISSAGLFTFDGTQIFLGAFDLISSGELEWGTILDKTGTFDIFGSSDLDWNSQLTIKGEFDIPGAAFITANGKVHTFGSVNIVGSSEFQFSATQDHFTSFDILAQSSLTFDVLSKGTIIYVWTGTEWRSGKLKHWNGTLWKNHKVKRWTGSEWEPIGVG